MTFCHLMRCAVFAFVVIKIKKNNTQSSLKQSERSQENSAFKFLFIQSQAIKETQKRRTLSIYKKTYILSSKTTLTMAIWDSLSSCLWFNPEYQRNTVSSMLAGVLVRIVIFNDIFKLDLYLLYSSFPAGGFWSMQCPSIHTRWTPFMWSLAFWAPSVYLWSIRSLRLR